MIAVADFANRSRFHSDVVLTQARLDAHQDRREVQPTDLERLPRSSGARMPPRNGTAFGTPMPTCRSRPTCWNARSSSSTSTSERGAQRTGSTARHSPGLRGCAGWNAGHPSISPRLSRSGRAKFFSSLRTFSCKNLRGDHRKMEWALNSPCDLLNWLFYSGPAKRHLQAKIVQN